LAAAQEGNRKPADANREAGAGGDDGQRPRTPGKGRERAAEIGIEGRSEMDKGELIDALRNH